MAALTATDITDNGFNPETGAVAATASDTAPIGSGHNTFAVYTNGTAGSLSVVALVPGNEFFGTAKADNTIAVPAGETRYIPLRKEYDDGTGRATLTTTTQDAAFTVAIVRMV